MHKGVEYVDKITLNMIEEVKDVLCIDLITSEEYDPLEVNLMMQLIEGPTNGRSIEVKVSIRIFLLMIVEGKQSEPGAQPKLNSYMLHVLNLDCKTNCMSKCGFELLGE